MEEDRSKYTIISKESLVPLGVVIALLYAAFSIGATWNERGVKIEVMHDTMEKHERRISLVEAQMTFWRREVEKKLGPLPDYSPADDKGDDDSDRRGNQKADLVLRYGTGADPIDPRIADLDKGSQR